jgi:membrane-bound ClpP family serine protease
MKKIALLWLVLTNVAMAGWPHENISQAVFASSIADRQPIEIMTEADDSLGKIYFFTNIRNLVGDTITHRWIYQDNIKAEISFNIKGKRWRVWSSKNIWQTWTGKWTVEVVDQNGQVLLVKTINFEKSEA